MQTPTTPKMAPSAIDKMRTIMVLFDVSCGIGRLMLDDPRDAMMVFQSAIRKAEKMQCYPLLELCERLKGVAEGRRSKPNRLFIADCFREAQTHRERQQRSLNRMRRWQTLIPMIDEILRNALPKLQVGPVVDPETYPEQSESRANQRPGTRVTIADRRDIFPLSVKIPPTPSARLPSIRKSPAGPSLVLPPLSAEQHTPVSIRTHLSETDAPRLDAELGSEYNSSTSASNSRSSALSRRSPGGEGPRLSPIRDDEGPSLKSPTSPYSPRPPGSSYRRYRPSVSPSQSEVPRSDGEDVSPPPDGSM